MEREPEFSRPEKDGLEGKRDGRSKFSAGSSPLSMAGRVEESLPLSAERAPPLPFCAFYRYNGPEIKEYFPMALTHWPFL